MSSAKKPYRIAVIAGDGIGREVTPAAIQQYYNTHLTTFGTPHDVPLEELRIKLFFPADASSLELFQRLAEPDRGKVLQHA